MVKRTINFELRTTSSTPREREFIQERLQRFAPEQIGISRVLDARTGDWTGYRFNVVFAPGTHTQALDAWKEVHNLSRSAIFYGRISIRGEESLVESVPANEVYAEA